MSSTSPVPDESALTRCQRTILAEAVPDEPAAPTAVTNATYDVWVVRVTVAVVPAIVPEKQLLTAPALRPWHTCRV
jgi:hypothetical protein